MKRGIPLWKFLPKGATDWLPWHFSRESARRTAQRHIQDLPRAGLLPSEARAAREFKQRLAGRLPSRSRGAGDHGMGRARCHRTSADRKGRSCDRRCAGGSRTGVDELRLRSSGRCHTKIASRREPLRDPRRSWPTKVQGKYHVFYLGAKISFSIQGYSVFLHHPSSFIFHHF